MRFLVTGAAGMVGSALCPFLRQEGYKVRATDINPSKEDLDFLDVRIFSKVENHIKEVQPDIIIHLAAETDVDKCEIEPYHAHLTNTIGTQNVALVCQRYDRSRARL